MNKNASVKLGGSIANRTSTASVLRELTVDADEIFDKFDTDKDQSISRHEFGQMFSAIRKAIGDEQHQLHSANRRNKMMRYFIILMVVFMLSMLLGNMGLGYILYQMTKELTVKQGGELTNTNGQAVQTGISIEDVVIRTTMPQTAEEAINKYERFDTLIAPSEDGSFVHGHKVAAWWWEAGPPAYVTFATTDGEKWALNDDGVLEVMAPDAWTPADENATTSSSRRQLGKKCMCRGGFMSWRCCPKQRKAAAARAACKK